MFLSDSGNERFNLFLSVYSTFHLIQVATDFNYGTREYSSKFLVQSSQTPPVSQQRGDNPVICELCKTKIVESVDILKSGFESLNPFTEKLLSLPNLFTNLVNKAESVQNSIEANLDHINTLNDALVNFKHAKEEPLQTVLSQNNEDYDFSLNLERKHVVHPVKPRDCCPTREMEEYTPNFLAVDSRNAIASFLTSLDNKFQSAKNNTIYLANPSRTTVWVKATLNRYPNLCYSAWSRFVLSTQILRVPTQ